MAITHVQAFTGALAGVPQLLVDARHLHAALDSGRDYSTWIKGRIEQYGFSEGEDYSPILVKMSDDKPGRPRTDYHLSLDMAKELAMIENTPRGRLARRYFIEMEQSQQHGAQELKRLAALMGGELLKSDPRRHAILRYRKLGLSCPEIGRLLRRAEDAIRREVHLLEACGLLTPSKQLVASRRVALANLAKREG